MNNMNNLNTNNFNQIYDPMNNNAANMPNNAANTPNNAANTPNNAANMPNNAANTPNNLVMFRGCTNEKNRNMKNEQLNYLEAENTQYCFLDDYEPINYSFQNRNEWSNVSKTGISINMLTNDAQIKETSIDYNKDNLGENLNQNSDKPLCELNNCLGKSECTPECRNLNCLNCHA